MESSDELVHPINTKVKKFNNINRTSDEWNVTYVKHKTISNYLPVADCGLVHLGFWVHSNFYNPLENFQAKLFMRTLNDVT